MAPHALGDYPIQAKEIISREGAKSAKPENPLIRDNHPFRVLRGFA
jgi:hypothetical protein